MTKTVDAEDGGPPQKGYKTVEVPSFSRRKKIVYLMRGVPASGKSFAALRLAGKDGGICETDAFFGLPGKRYRFKIRQRASARTHNMLIFMAYLNRGVTPIVIDRGCGKGRRTWWYIQTALLYGYGVKLAEPISPWWKSIRRMLAFHDWINPESFPPFEKWVNFLYQKQKKTHKVSKNAIVASMKRFDPNHTIEDIIGG